MATVSRSNFVDTLNQNGGYIDLRSMSPQLERAFKDNGISKEQLQQVAGQDQVIRGSREFKNLFSRVDALDSNGSATSFAAKKKGSLTKSGRVYQALQREVKENRAKTSKAGGRRFAGDAELAKVANGNKVLRPGDSGDHVKKAQQALIDSGFDIPSKKADGVYNEETKRAVRRFQAEVGLKVDGNIGSETLGALAATAPAPGKSRVNSAEYDKLYADGRLNVTIAMGFDETASTMAREQRQALRGLDRQGFKQINPSKMTAKQRQDLGLQSYDPNAMYFHKQFKDPKTGKNVDAIVRFISPDKSGGGAAARAAYEKAMKEDEVVIYAGHGRYGTGPDFDHKYKGKGNFVIHGRGHQDYGKKGPPAGMRRSIGATNRSDLSSLNTKPPYQLLIFNGCATESYLHSLRDPKKFGRTHSDTDIITTTISTRTATRAEHAVRFLEGVTKRETNNDLFAAQNKIEQDQLKRFKMHSEVPAAGGTYHGSGFLTNPEPPKAQPTKATK